MSGTKIKICGITSVEDGRLATQFGADLLGLIFAESRRQVSVERAEEIRDALPGVMMVGVFMDAPIDTVVETAQRAGVNMIQLHGRESSEYCDEVLTRTTLPIIKAFTAENMPKTTELTEYKTTSFFMFDLKKSVLESGDVNKHMQTTWKQASKKRGKGFRIFLAGALDESNVYEAIRQTNVYAVDVCRGVEASPGKKDPKAMERFIWEVRR